MSRTHFLVGLAYCSHALACLVGVAAAEDFTGEGLTDGLASVADDFTGVGEGLADDLTGTSDDFTGVADGLLGCATNESALRMGH
jgi:hypothetical protein